MKSLHEPVPAVGSPKFKCTRCFVIPVKENKEVTIFSHQCDMTKKAQCDPCHVSFYLYKVTPPCRL